MQNPFQIPPQNNLSSGFQTLQDPEGNRLKNNIKAIAQHPSNHIRDQIRDIRGAAKERLQQLDPQAHQEAEQHRPAEFGPFVPAQRKQEPKGHGHDNVQEHLSEKVASAQGNINKRHQIHGMIRVVQQERDGRGHRHHGNIEDQGQICVHEGIDKQAVPALGPPPLIKDENI